MIKISSIHRMLNYLKPNKSKKAILFKYRGNYGRKLPDRLSATCSPIRRSVWNRRRDTIRFLWFSRVWRGTVRIVSRGGRASRIQPATPAPPAIPGPSPSMAVDRLQAAALVPLLAARWAEGWSSPASRAWSWVGTARRAGHEPDTAPAQLASLSRRGLDETMGGELVQAGTGGFRWTLSFSAQTPSLWVAPDPLR